MRHLKFCCISILTNLLRTDNETGGRIQINEFERHSLPLPFNFDW